MRSLIPLMGQGFAPDLSKIPEILLAIGVVILLVVVANRLIDDFWGKS